MTNPCRPLGEGGEPRRAIVTCVKVADYQMHKGLSTRRMCCEGCVCSKGKRCKHCPTPMCVDGLLQMIALSTVCQTFPNLCFAKPHMDQSERADRREWGSEIKKLPTGTANISWSHSRVQGRIQAATCADERTSTSDSSDCGVVLFSKPNSFLQEGDMRTENRIIIAGSRYLSGRGFDNVRRVICTYSHMNVDHDLLRLIM